MNAGWFADPLGRYYGRYYDGTTWTARVSTDDNKATIDPLGISRTPVDTSPRVVARRPVGSSSAQSARPATLAEATPSFADARAEHAVAAHAVASHAMATSVTVTSASPGPPGHVALPTVRDSDEIVLPLVPDDVVGRVGSTVAHAAVENDRSDTSAAPTSTPVARVVTHDAMSPGIEPNSLLDTAGSTVRLAPTDTRTSASPVEHTAAAPRLVSLSPAVPVSTHTSASPVTTASMPDGDASAASFAAMIDASSTGVDLAELPDTSLVGDPAAAHLASAPAKRTGSNLGSFVASGAGVLMVAGALGPWVDLAGFSLRGSSEGEGQIVLLCGLVAIVTAVAFSVRRLPAQLGRILLGLAAMVGLFITVVNFFDARSSLGDIGGGPAWGLWIAMIGSLGLLVAVATDVLVSRRS